MSLPSRVVLTPRQFKMSYKVFEKTLSSLFSGTVSVFVSTAFILYYQGRDLNALRMQLASINSTLKHHTKELELHTRKLEHHTHELEQIDSHLGQHWKGLDGCLNGPESHNIKVSLL